MTSPPMPPAEFVAALATLGLSVRQYAEMTGISHNTMRHWAEARIATPELHAEWLRRHVAIRLADPAPTKEPSPKCAGAWPLGCKHPNSCAMWRGCTYLGCPHSGSSICAQIDAALADPAPTKETR